MHETRWTEKQIMAPGFAGHSLRTNTDAASILLLGKPDRHVLVVGWDAYWLHTSQPCDPRTAAAAIVVAYGPPDEISIGGAQ